MCRTAGSRRCSCFIAELGLAFQHGVNTLLRHDEQYEISRRAAHLQTETRSSEGVHSWSRPPAAEILAQAENHRAATPGSADAKAELLHIGKNDDAIGPCQDVCGNV